MPNRNKKNKQTQSIQKIDGQGNYYTERIAPTMRRIIPDGTFAKFGQRAGMVGGTALGARAGMAVPGAIAGRAVGGFLGGGLARLLGFGDYSVVSNSVFKESMAIPPGEAIPSFGVMGQETRVRHREFIKDIVVPASPLAFTNQSFTINAGNATTFPWLSALAVNYQQYRVNGMVFEFKTLSSDITAGGALGSLILATNYDVTEAAFADKVHMENSQYAVSAKPSCSQIHTIECDQKLTPKLLYVRDIFSATSGVDARMSDLGLFQLATSGLPGAAGAVIGELWVSYDISLIKPEIASPISNSGQVSFTGSKTNLFGLAGASQKGSAVTAATNTLTFPSPGQYLLELFLTGTVMSVPATTGTATTVAVQNSGFTAADTIGVAVYTVVVTSVNQTVILDASASTSVTVALARVATYVAAFG